MPSLASLDISLNLQQHCPNKWKSSITRNMTMDSLTFTTEREKERETNQQDQKVEFVDSLYLILRHTLNVLYASSVCKKQQ